jgi:hypothetical protein
MGLSRRGRSDQDSFDQDSFDRGELMASTQQLQQKLASVMGKRVATSGQEPPRLVRANSAFAKQSKK